MSQTPVFSRREQGKDARRARIVDAAYGLLREVGMADLSVKMIADRADLSAATVYNLFGSKGAVLAKVYERDLLEFERRVGDLPVTDSLDRIFAAIGVAADLYRADPRFYRAAMSEADAGLDREMVLSAHRPRVAFWSRMVSAAVSQGRLRQDASPERLGVLMIQISTGALLHWVSDLISADTLEAETAFGFAAALHPFASPEGRRQLELRLEELGQALAPPAAGRVSALPRT